MEKIKCAVEYEPFTSIDIECTGLDPVEDSILEIGAAFYDGKHKTPVRELSCLVVPDHTGTNVDYRLSGQPVALAMNKEILEEIVEAFRLAENNERFKKDRALGFPTEIRTKKGQLVLEESKAMSYLYGWMDFNQTTYNLGKKKNVLLGKNLNALDVPFLKQKMGKERWDKVTSFRNLCLTSMFAPFSRKTSPLKDINALRGLGTVSHRALQDAIETAGAVIDIYEKNLQW